MKDFLIPALGACLGIEIGFVLWEIIEPFLQTVSKGIRRLFK